MAASVIEGLKGALAVQVVGDPADPATDIGPVIDADAKGMLEAHLKRLEGDAKIVARARLPEGADKGHLFAPTIAEVPTPDYLEREVFGHERPRALVLARGARQGERGSSTCAPTVIATVGCHLTVR